MPIDSDKAASVVAALMELNRRVEKGKLVIAATPDRRQEVYTDFVEPGPFRLRSRYRLDDDALVVAATREVEVMAHNVVILSDKADPTYVELWSF